MRILLFCTCVVIAISGFFFQKNIASCNNILKRNIRVLKKIPHNESSFTQGLVFEDGLFYESSGGFGKSFIQVSNQKEVLKRVYLGNDVFAEGLAIKGDSVFVLSWKSHRGFVFNKKNLNFIREFLFDGEGWGLALNEGLFYLSDGTSGLRIYSSEFKLLETIEVKKSGQKLKDLNELEFIDNTLYGNIWQESKIVGIDPKKGCVIEEVDASSLVEMENLSDSNSVLNGIAYDKNSKDIYLTGKNWKYIYQVAW